jgi:hypothetical protein
VLEVREGITPPELSAVAEAEAVTLGEEIKTPELSAEA